MNLSRYAVFQQEGKKGRYAPSYAHNCHPFVAFFKKNAMIEQYSNVRP